jgi:zinc D-Ala-D-Ala carboxypeptidase
MTASNWPFFSIEELACKHCGDAGMDQDFMLKLVELRTRCGFALPLNSGHRCPTHNEKVSATGRTGPHTTRRAVDIGVSGEKAWTVLRVAMQMGVFSGIGVNQKGAHKGRFIHLDDLPRGSAQPRPTVWSY